jgi:site-specific DNA recombinase
MAKRAVLYARVSKDDTKRDGRNLRSQIEMGREYCQERGYTIVAELAEDDRGASGADFDLPKLNEALEMARAGEADVLVVRELDRFARKLAKQLIIEGQFKAAGAVCEYVLGDYPDTPEGRLNKHIRATIAEFEREKINERMVRGKHNKIKAGNVVTHKTTYGYKLVDVDGKHTLEVYEPEARIVRMIFDWYTDPSERLPLRGIARKLNKLGILTPKGGVRWWAGTLRGFLTSETYKGTWYYGKRKKTKDGGLVLQPRDDWLAVSVPAIVSEDVWQLAQVRLQQNKKNSQRNLKHVTHYLLRGHVQCASCGTRLYCLSCSNRDLFYYTCPVAAHGDQYYLKKQCECNTHHRADQVDLAVWEWIGKKMSNPDELRQELESRQEEQETANAPLRERLSIVGNLVAENRAQLERLLDLYLSGDFPKEMLTERKTRLEATIEALEKERHNLNTQLEQRTLTSEDLQTLEDFAEEVERAFARIDDDDFEAKRKLIERLDVKVVLAVEDGEKVAYVSSPVLGESDGLSVVSSTSRRSLRNLDTCFLLTSRIVLGPA